jgi:iron complex outermembrane receptor protein
VDFSGDLLGTKLWVTNTTYGLEANANVSFNKDGGILVGFDHKKYDWKNESIGLDGNGEDLPGPTSISEADLNTTGIYAEAQYRLYRYLKILGGIRQERHSTFGTETLPLVGAVLNPAEHTALKVSHGKHFLAPTPNDLFWPYQDFGFYSLKGNPDLKPETGYHSDITLEQGLFKDRIFATLSYYKWDVTDKIQWQSDSNWNYQPVNLDSFKGSGWEAGLRLGPYRDMNLSLSYTYTDAQEENEFVIRQAAYTPMHQFKGTVTHCSSFDLTTTFTARYVGKRYYFGSDKTIETPAGSLDSYWTADLKFSQRLFNNWRIELSGYNLFDKGYDTYLSPFTDYTTGETTLEGFPGAGRSLFLNIAYEF